MKQYLEHSEYIDWKHPAVLAKAAELGVHGESDAAIAKRCFEFVRDSIAHSWDFQKNPVTLYSVRRINSQYWLLLREKSFIGCALARERHSSGIVLPAPGSKDRRPTILPARA